MEKAARLEELMKWLEMDKLNYFFFKVRIGEWKSLLAPEESFNGNWLSNMNLEGTKAGVRKWRDGRWYGYERGTSSRGRSGLFFYGYSAKCLNVVWSTNAVQRILYLPLRASRSCDLLGVSLAKNFSLHLILRCSLVQLLISILHALWLMALVMMALNHTLQV